LALNAFSPGGLTTRNGSRIATARFHLTIVSGYQGKTEWTRKAAAAVRDPRRRSRKKWWWRSPQTVGTWTAGTCTAGAGVSIGTIGPA